MTGPESPPTSMLCDAEANLSANVKAQGLARVQLSRRYFEFREPDALIARS